MNAEYPFNYDYFERAVLIGPILKQPIAALISKWKVPDTDDERSVCTLGFFAFSLQILSYIRPPVGEPK